MIEYDDDNYETIDSIQHVVFYYYQTENILKNVKGFIYFVGYKSILPTLASHDSRGT